MTDSMNFGPEWLRNLSSDGSTTGVNPGGIRYQLAEYRYGREEMLALFEKGIPAPTSLCTFSPLYSEQPLPPLALVPPTEEDRQWQVRGPPMGASVRGGRGAAGPGERGGRVARGGRGAYQPYGRNPAYETGGGWGNGEQADWSPRKDLNYTRSSLGGVDNWRRGTRIDEDDGWRSSGGGVAVGHPGRGGEKGAEKWGRSSSWREGDDERAGPQDKTSRGWYENQRGPPQRRMWDNDDHLPEWATENLGEGGGTFDASGAFHGSDDEQDGKGSKREHLLQKSASQQNITSKTQHAPLSTSKSALSLSKPLESPSSNQFQDQQKELSNHMEEPEQIPMAIENEFKKDFKKDLEEFKKAAKSKQSNREDAIKTAKQSHNQNSKMDDPGNRVDEDFDKLQEDLVLKLVVDEEPANATSHVPHSNGVQPPPNMMSPMQEKWYYQDPQGDLQGPFLSTEMAEWFKAGYFSANLFVRRQCDEHFYTLGDLVAMCNGNPFQTTVPILPLKQEAPKLTDEMLQYHQLMQAQLALRARPFGQGEPWSALSTMQQRELLAQQLLSQPQMPPEPYMQQAQNSGSALLQMLNQLNQVKMSVQQTVVEKPPNTIPCQLDPLQALVQQMGGMQRAMQPPGNMTSAMGAPAPMKHEPPMPNLHGLPVNGLPGGGVPVLPPNTNLMGMPGPGLAKMDGDNRNFLQFLQKPHVEQSIDLESLWRKTQYAGGQQNNPSPPQQVQPPQWQPTDKPISMWDMPTPPNLSGTPPEVQQMNMENLNSAKEAQTNDAGKEAAREEKKKKEAEEKRVKREAEERRKAEQKKQEAEKKLVEEKRRREEERIKREIERAKKESEEKRQRELAEKRRLKELRKAEEEARKKAEELKKMEDQERERLAAKEHEEQLKKQAEFARQAVVNSQKLSRAAPWSQSMNSQGLSLSEIQKLERERKAEQVALMQQQRLQQQEQMSPEKPTSLQLNWANKPVKLNQVKSLAEIQAEEQERLSKVKQATEKAQQKEKETISPPASRIWQGQTLTWTNNDNISSAGFWEEPPQQKPVVTRVNTEMKVVKQNAMVAPKQVVSKTKTKLKRDEQSGNNNGPTTDDFADWCSKTLANMNTQVDIPTFVTFLRDIESALDVREYCRDYLGDKPATQNFAAQFLEKRRLFKPKVTSHKDDMCSPAPAITPSTQHNTDFQEVKGKGKKCKKSKMLKVDARILGFNVTAAEDRINVGARDYGDTI